jgi:2,3-bisphosphoglycerate-dependent phosphoglycerate mutase
MRLLLIRHAESAGNAAGILQGRAEYQLSPRGRLQAELLAGRVAGGIRPQALFASPLRRADETARPIAAATGLEVQPLPGVMEYDFGEANGMPFAEARERFGGQRSGTGYLTFPREEGRAVFRDRVCAALFGLEADARAEIVAVVSHAGPIAAFCSAVLGLPHTGRPPFAIHNASITIVELREGRGTLHGINDTCHLDGLE